MHVCGTCGYTTESTDKAILHLRAHQGIQAISLGHLHEAFNILQNPTILITTRQHLEALNVFYEGELIEAAALIAESNRRLYQLGKRVDKILEKGPKP